MSMETAHMQGLGQALKRRGCEKCNKLYRVMLIHRENRRKKSRKISFSKLFYQKLNGKWWVCMKENRFVENSQCSIGKGDYVRLEINHGQATGHKDGHDN